MSLLSILDIAGSGLAAQSVRLNTTASNLANVDDVAGDPTQVYRARHPLFRAAPAGINGEHSFADHMSAVGVSVQGVVESELPPIARYQPGHPQANEDGLVYASNVNAVEEMANMISASRSYQSNLEVINTSKELLARTLSIGQ